MLYCIEGELNINTFTSFCQSHNLHKANLVFLFPGNASHHRHSYDLYAHKTGGGLARFSGLLGNEGYATLSLPTTGMDDWKVNPRNAKIVELAVADLWYAIGANFNLVLPVREHLNNIYFPKALTNTSYEPSLWGGIQSNPNLALGAYYLINLELIIEFTNQNNLNILETIILKDINFYNAYLTGKKSRKLS